MGTGANRKTRRRSARLRRRLVQRGAGVGLLALQACFSPDGNQLQGSPDAGGDRVDAAVDLDSGFKQAPDASMPPFIEPHPVVDPAVFAKDVLQVAQGVPAVLYSWTTAEQVDELRTQPVLLTRSARTDLGEPHVRNVLQGLAVGGMEGEGLARTLLEAPFDRMRFAWVNPWATLLGWPDEKFGDQLLRIELRPEARIVHLVKGTITVTDLSGAHVPLETALVEPELLAAIYFVNAGDPGVVCGGSFASTALGVFRELVVINEGMVAGWSLGTAAIAEELERSMDVIAAYAEVRAQVALDLSAVDMAASACCMWTDRSGSFGNVETAYLDALALPNELYMPTAAKLEVLGQALQDALANQPPELVHVAE